VSRFSYKFLPVRIFRDFFIKQEIKAPAIVSLGRRFNAKIVQFSCNIRLPGADNFYFMRVPKFVVMNAHTRADIYDGIKFENRSNLSAAPVLVDKLRQP
jgi:hypothetical protein